jgi:hypothetical protein
MLTKDDRIPPELKSRIKEFGHFVLIREGPPLCCEKKKDPIHPWNRSKHGQISRCVCPWTGDEFWIGFGQSDRIGSFLDQISAIQYQIGTAVAESAQVEAQVDVCNSVADEAIKVAFQASVDTKSDLLKLKASLTKTLTAPRQEELDGLWRKIAHLHTPLSGLRESLCIKRFFLIIFFSFLFTQFSDLFKCQGF